MERGQGGRVRPQDGPQADLLAALLSISVLQYMSQNDQAKMMTTEHLSSFHTKPQLMSAKPNRRQQRER